MRRFTNSNLALNGKRVADKHMRWAFLSMCNF